MPYCDYCLPRPRWFPTLKAAKHHRSNSPGCKWRWNQHLMNRLLSTPHHNPHDPEDIPRSDEPEGGYDPPPLGVEPFDLPLEDLPSFEAYDQAPEDVPIPSQHTAAPPKLRRRVKHHVNRPKTYGRANTSFEARREEEERNSESPYRNFESDEVFEMAEWMLTAGVSQKQGTRLLKTKMLQRSKARWKNASALLKDVDKLPRGPEWHYHTFDVPHPTKEDCIEQAEIYYRDPLESIKAIVSNPEFNSSDIMSYEPVEVYVGPEGCTDEEMKREYGEMNSGEWWNRLQGKLPDGATIAPVILSSDKTQLSMFGGDKSAWPVYITIGNIAKGIRRQPSKHAVYLLGYLNATKLSFIEAQEPRSLAIKRLFHDSMRHILEPLKKAGKEGVLMTCADGLIRKVFPILSSYVADHPEQCLIACTKHSFCPICEVPPDERGDLTSYPYRKHNKTVKAILSQTHKNVEHDLPLTSDNAQNFRTLGLHPINPFWSGMASVDEDTLLTPDILHQLHKGMVQTHLLNWTKSFIGDKELDRRFQALPKYSGLRHFGKGVSHIIQMTGKEQKELEKVLMVIMTGGSSFPKQAIAAASGLLNFIYLARFPHHTKDSLQLLNESLKRFHQYKGIFFGGKCCKDFNRVPKLHSMQHYERSICEKGAADGFSTEAPERLHIEFAKKAYRASNKNDYLKQMVKWIERQEAINYMRAYLAWREEYHSFIDDPGGIAQTGDSDDDWNWFLSDEDDEDHAPEEEAGNPNETQTPLPSTVTSGTKHPPPIHAVANPLAGHPPRDDHVLTKNPAFENQTFQAIEERHHAPDFRWYFFDHMTRACPAVYNQFDEGNTSLEVWRSFKMAVPQIRDITASHAFHTVFASPSHLRENHLTSNTISGRFDTVFIDYKTTPEAEGFQNRYRIAQVRVIFKISRHSTLFPLYPEPMAYVELFNRLPATPHKDTGLITVTRSFRQNQRHAAIVPISSIHLPCHLTPLFGRMIPRAWLLEGGNREDPLDSDQGTFLVNPFVTLSTYSFFFRLGLVPLAEDRLQRPIIVTQEQLEDGSETGDDSDEDGNGDGEDDLDEPEDEGGDGDGDDVEEEVELNRLLETEQPEVSPGVASPSPPNATTQVLADIPQPASSRIGRQTGNPSRRTSTRVQRKAVVSTTATEREGEAAGSVAHNSGPLMARGKRVRVVSQAAGARPTKRRKRS